MLEAKKYSIIEWLISVADEKVVDAVDKIRERSTSAAGSTSAVAPKRSYPTSSYAELKSRRIDVNQLKARQNYQALTSGELQNIVDQADIQEPLSKLLQDLEELG